MLVGGQRGPACQMELVRGTAKPRHAGIANLRTEQGILVWSDLPPVREHVPNPGPVCPLVPSHPDRCPVGLKVFHKPIGKEQEVVAGSHDLTRLEDSFGLPASSRTWLIARLLFAAASRGHHEKEVKECTHRHRLTIALRQGGANASDTEQSADPALACSALVGPLHL